MNPQSERNKEFLVALKYFFDVLASSTQMGITKQWQDIRDKASEQLGLAAQAL